MNFIIGLMFVLVAIGAIAGIVRGMSAAALPSKFVSLNPLAGKSRSEIEAVVGPPNGISSTVGGKVLCQWMAGGYHIALIFDGREQESRCEGVTHEVSV